MQNPSLTYPLEIGRQYELDGALDESGLLWKIFPVIHLEIEPRFFGH
jgi:hypothetical protein